ncbi:PiggyBac transposable element-derived protein 4, partial [Harpegnathos saltator]
QFWEALITDEIFQKIVEHTNQQIEHVCAIMMAKGLLIQSYHEHTNIVEIKAVIGLFYYAGARKDSNVDVHDMWNKKHGLTVYRCTMSRNRFSFLCMCIRFDDKKTRNKNDRFAPIRDIWNIFIENCRNCYNIGKKTTVDEQLLSFRGRCVFRMYIKAKPDKYGLKVITLNDASTFYLYHAIPYLG